MKKLLLMVIAGMFCLAITVNAQDEKAMLTETMYLLPKEGMAKQFEEGVATHNKKFHASGKENEAMLRRVEYGTKAGWYVWVMNGSYASLDNRPDDDAHSKDWEQNVGKYVKEYGDVDLWSYNKEMSYGAEKFANQKRYEVWAMYLKPWQGYRFNEAMKKVHKAFEKMDGRTMLVFDNQVNKKDGADVGIVWGYDNFADLENDDDLVEIYEEMYGDGSWRLFLEEWRASVVDVDEEHRVKVKM